MNRAELTALPTAAAPSRVHRLSLFDKPGRDVALVAVLQIVCFLMLLRLEPRFFIVHLYQIIPYVAIILLVGYSLDHWAYAIGMLVSIFLFGLAYLAGLLGSAVEQLRSPGDSDTPAVFVAALALTTAVLAVLMAVLCRVRWIKGQSERREGRRIFLLSLAIVAGYYIVLLHWFWDMVRDA